MLMLSKYQLELAEQATTPSEMFLSIGLIIVVLLLIVFGRRILLLINGKKADEDLDEEVFVEEED